MRTLAETRRLRELIKDKIYDDEKIEKQMTESAEILRTSRPESESEDEPEEIEPKDESEDELEKDKIKDILPTMEKLFIFGGLNNCVENRIKYNIEPKIGVIIKQKDFKRHLSNYQVIYRGQKVGEIKINFSTD